MFSLMGEVRRRDHGINSGINYDWLALVASRTGTIASHREVDQMGDVVQVG